VEVTDRSYEAAAVRDDPAARGCGGRSGRRRRTWEPRAVDGWHLALALWLLAAALLAAGIALRRR
jgi:hypothetical protein